MSANVLAIVGNDEVIAVNQDPLGKPVRRLLPSPASALNGTSKVYLAPCQAQAHPLHAWQQFSVVESGQVGTQQIKSQDGRCLGVWGCKDRWPWWTSLAPCAGEDIAAEEEGTNAGCPGAGQQWSIDLDSGTIATDIKGGWPGKGGESASSSSCLMNEGSNVEIDQCGWAVDSNRMRWSFHASNSTIVNRATGLCLTIADGLEVYAGPLHGDGRFTAILFNRSPREDNVTLDFSVRASVVCLRVGLTVAGIRHTTYTCCAHTLRALHVHP